MFAGWMQIRAEERRPTLIAFATLTTAMAGHGLLETARDALFLARIHPTRLPFVYLAVAALALVTTAVAGRRAAARADGSRRLSLLLLGCGLVTLAFWPVVEQGRDWALYALYVWSATAATLLVARFWLTVSARFTVTQAKRVYALIGAGSVLGAIAGTALAGALTLALPARDLLLAAGLSFAIASIGPLLFERSKHEPRPEKSPLGEHAAAERFDRRALASPYVRRVAILVLLSTVAVTLVDYAFKSEVAEHVPKGELGSFFARFYLTLNFVSLAAQLLLVRWAVRLLSTTGSLAVLPVLIGAGGLAIAAGGGLAGAIGAKAFDGALRHSLHRTAVELLYLPMADRVRSAAKTLAEVLAQRGGQALASFSILAAVAAGAGPALLGLLVAIVAVGWLTLALGLRPLYLELFRSTLREGAEQPRVKYPELDLSSLESVIASLNSRNDAEVCAALHYLADEGRARLIPALILYHPSPEVVVEALEILVKAGRSDFVPIADRLMEQAGPTVRAAALRAKTAIDPDLSLLERFSDVDCPSLRATALVGLEALGRGTDETLSKLEEIARFGSTDAKLTLANAIRLRPTGRFEDFLIAMSHDTDVAVRRGALAAMAAQPSARYLGPLVKMLGQRELRADARATLIELGDRALGFLAGALSDEQRPLAVRRHLPRTVMRFPPHKAAPILLEQLQVEKDGVVRYKILRALGHLRAHNPELSLDAQVVGELTRRTVSNTFRLIAWRVALERGKSQDARRATPTLDLLIQLLRDKEVHAIERLFRLLGLTHPTLEIETMYRGLKSRRADVRASSRELVEHLLDSPLRGAVLGLIDDGPDDVRLAAAGPFHDRALPSYEAALAELLEVAGEGLRSIAVYHIGELGLTELRPNLESLDSGHHAVLDRITRRALELLDLRAKRPKLALT